jgi:hypothetical protein
MAIHVLLGPGWARLALQMPEVLAQRGVSLERLEVVDVQAVNQPVDSLGRI